MAVYDGGNRGQDVGVDGFVHDVDHRERSIKI